MNSEEYDIIICGTGFASAFFLNRLLLLKPNSRVLVLERGRNQDYAEALATKKYSNFTPRSLYTSSGLPNKEWLFTLAAGGGSNCWWGQTPRQMPEDFEMKSRFGVGTDWPVTYSELEQYYGEAEALMMIAGPPGESLPYPTSAELPQPAHRSASLDLLIRKSVGDRIWVPSPTARSSMGTSRRARCLAAGTCGLCPIDAKFRIMNDFYDLFESPSVDAKFGAEVTSIDVKGNNAEGVFWTQDGQERYAKASLVVLGMNALFNASVLLKSGDKSNFLGRKLHEQVSIDLEVDLASSASFDGGSHITSLGYMFYAGKLRSGRAACLVEHKNAPPLLRLEKGKMRQRAIFKLVFEVMPSSESQLKLTDHMPHIHYCDYDQYTTKAIAEVPREFVALLDNIAGVERFEVSSLSNTEGHICGTVVMSEKSDSGVVDPGLVHHSIRNLLVLGSSSFPTSPPANPSLTIAALSLRAATRLFS